MKSCSESFASVDFLRETKSLETMAKIFNGFKIYLNKLMKGYNM